MNQRKMGRTGLSVSELCLGTMNFGWTIDRDTAFAILDAFRAAGGSFLQSVCIWPDLAILPNTMNAPEKWIGEWMQSRAIPRSEVVLASRITLQSTAAGGSAALANSIRRCCEDTLARLGIRYLDILVCEWQVPLQPVDDALRAFEMLIAAGYVRHIAAANFPLWRAMEAIGRSAARNCCRYEALQMEYPASLPGFVKNEMMDFCREYKLGLLATSVLGGSVPRLVPSPSRGFHQGLFEQREAFPEFAPRKVSLENPRLAAVLSNPQVTAVVISVNSTEQLAEVIRTSDRKTQPTKI